MEQLRKETRSPAVVEYLETLCTINERYTAAGLRPLFVGGVVAKAVSLSSIERMQFDHGSRTVTVPVDTASYTSKRRDGTYDDFDIIVNHPNEQHVAEVMEDTQQMLKWQGYHHHFVSTEAVRYPSWRPRNRVLQMVSGIEVDHYDNVVFTFGRQQSAPIPPETMEPWQYVFTDNGKEVISLPSFNPAFIGLRYIMRVPLSETGGLRAKDTVSKTDEETGRQTTKFHTLMKLREKALATGVEQGHTYDSAAWQQFILAMQHPDHQDRLTHWKSELMKFWWKDLASLSTAIVHGQGVFAELAKLGNKMGG